MLKQRLLPDRSSSASSHDDDEERNEGGYTTTIFYNATESGDSSDSINSDSDNGEEESQQLLNIPRGLMKKGRFVVPSNEDSLGSLSDESNYSDDEDDEESYNEEELQMETMRMNKISDIVKNSGDFKVLPDEVILHIFKHLDSDSLGRVSRTCKRFHDVNQYYH